MERFVAFAVSSDVRRDRIFPFVGTGIVSTLPSSPTLLDATPSEKKDPRPIAGTQTSTVTYFTADQTTATQSDLTICLSHPSSKTHPFAKRHSAFQMTVLHTATKFKTTVGVTQSSEYTATHQLVLYMPTPTAQATLLVPTTYVEVTHTAPIATKFNDPRFNDPRFFPHYSHPPYDTSRQHSRHICSTAVPRTTMVASTVLQGSGHPCASTRLVTAKVAARKIDIQFF